MSEEAKPAAKKEAQPAHDPIQELAEKLYIELAARAFAAGAPAEPKPDPRLIAQTSFKLAEAFQAANYEFNPTAIAAREAKAKAAVNLDSVQIDFGAIGKSAGKPA